MSLCANFWYGFFPLSGAPWRNRLLDGVVIAASVLVAYWGTAETLLLGLDTKRVVERLKQQGYWKRLVWYFTEALISGFLLIVCSIALEPVRGHLPDAVLSSLWLGVAAWSSASSIRGYRVLHSLLIQAGRQ